MEEVDENERVEGWKEQLREEKREGGVDLRRQNMMRGSGRSGTTRVPGWMGVSSVRACIETGCADDAWGHHSMGRETPTGPCQTPVKRHRAREQDPDARQHPLSTGILTEPR